MTTEQLEAYIGSQKIEEGQVEEENEQVAESNSEEDQEKVQDEQAQPTTQYKDPFQGKSAEELLKIIQDQQRFISQQGNEIGKFRKEIEEVKKVTVKNTPVEEDNEFAEWDKDQLQVVEKLVEKKLQKLSQEETNRTTESRHRAHQQNLEAYEALKNDQELFSVIAPQLDKMFESAGDQAIFTEGWVQNAIGTAVRGLVKQSLNTQQPAQTNNLDQKKKAATTVTSTGSSISKGPKKDTRQMTADEYLLEAQKSLGLRDLRSKKNW
jgi:hypothetical protein